MTALILCAILFTAAVGAGVLWANPQRLVNQVFAAISLTATLWMNFVLLALQAGELYSTDPTANPIPWLRANAALAALFPWLIWLLKESILLGEKTKPYQILRRSSPWVIAAGLMVAIALSNYFIPADSSPDNPKRGSGYLVYAATSFLLYIILLLASFRQMRLESGIRRIEMQFLTVNVASACFLALVFNAIGAYSDLRSVARLSPLAVLICYALTAWAVTVHRVFDARQVFLSVVQRLCLVLFLGLGIFGVDRLLQDFLTPAASLLLSVAAGSSFAFVLERKTREWFRLTPEQHIAELRSTMIEAARSEPSPDKLVTVFEGLLRSWSQAGHARLLFDSGEVYASGDIDFTKDRPAHAALCRSGWSTPESLQRQRAEPGLVDLRQFLTEFDLGLAVTAPRGSKSPSLLLVLGTKVNHRPFTYPEVQQVQEIAEFMDNILARSRLTRQARQSEQLATIGLLGASLAHEIRNPLVSIKTFAHLLPARFEDPEFRRRFKVLIPAEVDRIENLTQQLLDLSNPRRHQMEHISLHAVARETVELMLTRANEAGVNLVSTLNATADTIWADASAVRQVIINLLINAFQALELQETDRRVELKTRNSPNGSVILEVSDNGPGIPSDQRGRLFHPFESTKTKGMGLGLAVCADILHEHKAAIIVPDIGRPGATFRITFPCPPPLS
jgi:signal transduction histidine kinase